MRGICVMCGVCVVSLMCGMRSALQCVAVCCSALQCVAVCNMCNVCHVWNAWNVWNVCKTMMGRDFHDFTTRVMKL